MTPSTDGLVPDFVCGDEVYGSCTKLREHLEQAKQCLRAARAEELPDHHG